MNGFPVVGSATLFFINILPSVAFVSSLLFFFSLSVIYFTNSSYPSILVDVGSLSSATASTRGGGGFGGVGGVFVGVFGLRIPSNNLIVSSASACVDCGSIDNGFLSSASILFCLISFVSPCVGFSPITLLKLIAGDGAFIGLKNDGIELSIKFLLDIVCSVAVVDSPTRCGPYATNWFSGSMSSNISSIIGSVLAGTTSGGTTCSASNSNSYNSSYTDCLVVSIGSLGSD